MDINLTEEEPVYDFGLSDEEQKQILNNYEQQKSVDTANLVASYVNSGVDLTTSIISAIQSGKASEEQTKQLQLQLQMLQEQNAKGNNVTDYATLLALMEQQQSKSKTGTYIAIGCGVAALSLLAYLAFKK